MDFSEGIEKYIQKEIEVLKRLDIQEIDTCIRAIVDTYKNDGNIYIFGNGGSASTASHFACDFNKGLNEFLDKKIKFICLNDNIPTIMAIANDIGYDFIFEFQLKNKLNVNDLVVGISGSGNSNNVIRAIEYAKEVGVKTVGITGYDGGKLKKISDYSINVDVDDMQISEDIHMILDHLMMRVIMNYLRVNNRSDVNNE